MTTRVLSRFLAKIRVEEGTGCWIWTACRDKDGYGIFGTRRAHRVAYEHFYNHALQPGEQVLHKCPGKSNASCVNPAHLFKGRHQTNMDYGVLHGEFVRGEAVCTAKLTEESVREIHRRYTVGDVAITTLADEFGVHYSVIHDIIKGVTWKHLNLPPQDRMRGERLKFARLNAEAVREIRHLAAEGVHEKELGAKFNVHYNTVRDVIFGRTWKHVE